MHEKEYQQQGAAWTMPAEWKPARGIDVPVMKHNLVCFTHTCHTISNKN